MYPEGLKDLIDGWSKGFSSGAGRTPLPLLLFIIAWTTGLMLAPTMLLLSGDRWTWLAVCGLCVGQVAWMLRRTGTFHWSVALLYPVPLMFFFAVFGRSAWRAGRGREVSWKGRQIRAD
jgi:4,4'-diaponeurosporenoate glycosyltransferase